MLFILMCWFFMAWTYFLSLCRIHGPLLLFSVYLELNNDNNDDENTNVTCTEPKWLLLSLKHILPQTWSQRYNSLALKKELKNNLVFYFFLAKKAKYEEDTKTNVSKHFKNQFHISLTLRTCHSMLVPKVNLLFKVPQSFKTQSPCKI